MDAETIYVYRPRCPHCHGVEFNRQRSEKNGDGSQTMKATCKSCKKPLKIVRDFLPLNGKDE